MTQIAAGERQRLAQSLAEAIKSASEAEQASAQAQAQAARQATEIEGLLEGGERLALRGELPPLVRAFVNATLNAPKFHSG